MKPQKYRNIADDLRVRIKSGALKPGQQLPTLTTLASEYDVAEGTVRTALRKLAGEGLIEGRRPVGTFVRDQRRYPVQADVVPGFAAQSPNLADQLLSAMATPEQPLTQTVRVDLVRPPTEIAERLGVGTERAVLRHRVMSVGNTPASLADGYYPARLVADTEIMQPVLIERGVAAVLADVGAELDRLVDEVYVRMPNPTESRDLRLPSGTPVLVQLCTAYTADAVPVSCWLSVLPGDRHVLISERHREVAANMRAVG